LPNEKGGDVGGLAEAGGKPLIGALNPKGVLTAAVDEPLGTGVVDDTAVDGPLLSPKKLGTCEGPEGVGAVEGGFEGSG
jgi:hypothetical protein